ncbi:MAG: hypothetical protein MUE51_01190 [Thermoleophilia bacterium]|jgi:flagellar basal-body rod modification protein FlgD|nr:hypothetical protein [Thermoleophilia bacterium]
MSDIPPVTGAYQPVTNDPTAAKPRNDPFSQQGFLNLLAAQMRSQNPLEPLKDTEFLAQMAQFQTYEQVAKLNQGMSALNLGGQLGQGAALIGREVTYVKDDGTTNTGTVQRVLVDPQTRGVTVVVDGTPVAIERVAEIGAQG